MSASITLPERYTVFRQTVAQRVLGEADSYELAQVAELPVGKLASRHKLSPAAVASFDAAADAWTRWAAYEQSDDPDFIQQVLSKEAGDQISTLCLISRTAMNEAQEEEEEEQAAKDEPPASQGTKVPSSAPVWLLTAAKPGSNAPGYVRFGMFHKQLQFNVLWEEGAIAIDELQWEPSAADFATLMEDDDAAKWAEENVAGLAKAAHLRAFIPFHTVSNLDVGSEVGGGSGAGLEADELTITLSSPPVVLSAPVSTFDGDASSERFHVSRDGGAAAAALGSTLRIKVKVPHGALEGGAAGPRANRSILSRLRKAVAASAGKARPAARYASPPSVLDSPAADDDSAEEEEEEGEEGSDGESEWEECSDDEEEEELLAQAEAGDQEEEAEQEEEEEEEEEQKEEAAVPAVEEATPAPLEAPAAVEAPDAEAGAYEAVSANELKQLKKMMRKCSRDPDSREELRQLLQGAAAKARGAGEEDAALELEALIPGAEGAGEEEPKVEEAPAEPAPRSDLAVQRAEKRRLAKERKRAEAAAAAAAA